MAKTILEIDQETLRQFSVMLRMSRENHRRIYLEYKSANWHMIEDMIFVLTKYNIQFSLRKIRENRNTIYMRKRIYVYGEEAFKVLRLIDYDFKDANKNKKIKAIKGLYYYDRRI